MRKSKTHDYAKALHHAIKDAGPEDREKITAAFIELLFRTGNLKKAHKILDAFSAYNKNQSGIISITITTAKKIDDEILETIKKVFGKSVEAVTEIDPEMIGGIKIRTKDTIIDGSISTQLTNLKQQLT